MVEKRKEVGERQSERRDRSEQGELMLGQSPALMIFLSRGRRLGRWERREKSRQQLGERNLRVLIKLDVQTLTEGRVVGRVLSLDETVDCRSRVRVREGESGCQL